MADLSIKLDQKQAEFAVRLAAGFTGKQPAAAAFLRIEAASGRVRIAAGGDAGRVALDIDGAYASEGSMLVHGATLAGLLARAPGESIILKQDAAKPFVSVQVGRNSYRVGIIAEPFGAPLTLPEAWAAERVALSTTVFQDCLGFVLHAAARADARQYLNGVYVQVCRDRLRMAATDGHRLAAAVHPMEPPLERDMEPVIIPIASALKLAAIVNGAPEIQFYSEGSHFWLADGAGFWFAGNGLVGSYPDVATVIPSGGRPAKLDLQKVSQAMERAAVVLGDAPIRSVDLDVEGRALRIHFDYEISGLRETLPIEGADGCGLRLNPDYLRAAIKAFEDAGEEDPKVFFNENQAKPFKIEAADHSRVAIIMPVRR